MHWKRNLLLIGSIAAIALPTAAEVPVLKRQQGESCFPIGRVLRTTNTLLPIGTKLCRDDQLVMAPTETVTMTCDISRQVKTFQGITVFSQDNSCLTPSISRCPHNSARTCRRVRGSEAVATLDIDIFGNVISSDRPTINWKPMDKAAQYSVRISGAGINWTKLTQKPQLQYPTEQPELTAGNTYTLLVTAFSQDGKSLGTETKTLVLLPATMSHQLETDIQAVDGWKLPEVETIFQKVTILISHQLYDEAIRLVQQATDRDQSEPSLYRLLGNLYSDVGLPQIAKSNYETATALARKINNPSELKKAELALSALKASFQQ
jgi:Tfp pilus assembly major pilin PilA